MRAHHRVIWWQVYRFDGVCDHTKYYDRCQYTYSNNLFTEDNLSTNTHRRCNSWPASLRWSPHHILAELNVASFDGQCEINLIKDYLLWCSLSDTTSSHATTTKNIPIYAKWVLLQLMSVFIWCVFVLLVFFCFFQIN